jgi:hypothetical protein
MLQVNEVASRLTQQQVHGDAVLTLPGASSSMSAWLDALHSQIMSTEQEVAAPKGLHGMRRTDSQIESSRPRAPFKPGASLQILSGLLGKKHVVDMPQAVPKGVPQPARLASLVSVAHARVESKRQMCSNQKGKHVASAAVTSHPVSLEQVGPTIPCTEELQTRYGANGMEESGGGGVVQAATPTAAAQVGSVARVGAARRPRSHPRAHAILDVNVDVSGAVMGPRRRADAMVEGRELLHATGDHITLGSGYDDNELLSSRQIHDRVVTRAIQPQGSVLCRSDGSGAVSADGPSGLPVAPLDTSDDACKGSDMGNACKGSDRGNAELNGHGMDAGAGRDMIDTSHNSQNCQLRSVLLAAGDNMAHASGASSGQLVDMAPWVHLPEDVLGAIFQKLDCGAVVAASGVCRSWREFALKVCKRPTKAYC